MAIVVALMVATCFLPHLHVVGPIMTIVVVWLLYESTYGLRYRIVGVRLIIKSFMSMSIDIGSIKSIRSCNNVLSSGGAASLQRLEIAYGKYKRTYVSPEDEQGFIEALLKVNPSIKVRKY